MGLIGAIRQRMNHLGLAPYKFDVSALSAQLEAHPEVWDEWTVRTEHPMSPHREAPDIWVRYNPKINHAGDMQAFNGPHTSEWYPVIAKIPAVIDLCWGLCVKENADLGGVFITKVPAGKQIYPHVDGGWHASTYEKFIITVKGNERQSFNFDGESLATMPGEAFWFDNAYSHWVKNDSDEDRISLIVCIRR